jgi:hypothetical protein
MVHAMLMGNKKERGLLARSSFGFRAIFRWLGWAEFRLRLLR